MNFVKGRLYNAVGAYFEYKVINKIGGVVGLSYRRIKVEQGLWTGPNHQFTDMIEDAEDDGIITEEQYLQIRRLDLVLTGRRKSDGAEVYIAAEVSETIDDSDITCAAEGAESLAVAVGQPTIPAVIGLHIDDARRALASTNNVSVFLYPDD